MKKNLKRLVVALIISSGCFMGTVIWFNSGKAEDRASDVKAIARLNNSSNEVERKPLKRVIWESVTKNDEFFPGEAVRTASNAEAQLYFMKSHTTIHLDPDSLVVLEENDKGLSLDFLQGNMFVQSSKDDTGGEGLTLKTGNGEIKLKSADMSLTKNQNGNVDLEVHRGNAELNQGGKKTDLNKEHAAELSEKGVSVAQDHIEMLQPQAGDTIYLNLSKGEKLKMGWKALSKDYSMRVEMGRTRSQLAQVPGLDSPGEAGQLELTPKPGRWYFRLTAVSTNPNSPKVMSSVVPVIVEAKSPPSLLEPRLDASIQKAAPDTPVGFHWMNRHKFQSQIIEVASDQQFKNVKMHETLTGEDVTFAKDIGDGAYFWRVTGFLKVGEKSEGLSSATGKFSVVSKWEAKPPALASPAPAQHLSVFDAHKSGVSFKWQPVQGVDRYKLTLEENTKSGWKPQHEQETETTMAKVMDLKPGLYQWSVKSLDEKGVASKASLPSQFTIEEMPKLEWVSNEPTIDYQYRTPTPSIAAHWKAMNTLAASYRFKVAPEDQGIESASSQTTKQTFFDISVANEGRYVAQIEALDAKDRVIGQSDVKIIEVKRQPLLPAPAWAENTPDVLKSDAKGNLTLGWSAVEGANHYLMILESPDGKVIDQKEVSRNTASLNRLKPGEYQVHVRSVDGLKRPGLDGQKRKLEVPATSDIRAPKIKAMKVK